MCLYGDAGQGKTVALQYALAQLPHPARVRRVHVGVHPTVPELRRVLANALELGRRLPRGAGEADLTLVNALRQPRVLAMDEAHSLPGPTLEFLPGLCRTHTVRYTHASRAALRLRLVAVRSSACRWWRAARPARATGTRLWSAGCRSTPRV
ncbi:ATP-binding protein [Streptomyces sp. NPDC002386]